MQRQFTNLGSSYTPPIRYVPVLNTETVAVPPYGVMEVFDVDKSDDGTGNPRGDLKIRKPTANSLPTGVLVINGSVAIPAYDAGTKSGYGQGIMSYPTPCAIEPDNAVPEVGANAPTWGTVTGSWYLNSGNDGFIALPGGSGGICNMNVSPPGPPGDGSFWAVILGSSIYGHPVVTTGPFSWLTATPDLGEFSAGLPGGTRNAYEVNGHKVEPGTIVRMWPALDGKYYFWAGGGNSGISCVEVPVSIACVDGVPQFTTKYLIFDGTKIYLSDTSC